MRGTGSQAALQTRIQFTLNKEVSAWRYFIQDSVRGYVAVCHVKQQRLCYFHKSRSMYVLFKAIDNSRL